MEIENRSPLVSVIIIAYNSGKFILETLESIKNQTYDNIELIVTDDGSKDNTIAICKDWIDRNKSRFINAILVTTPHNTGTAGNANRGIQASAGEWIKFIAGDDILMSNAIEKYIEFVDDKINACFAEYVEFTGQLSEHNYRYKHIDIDRVAFGERTTARRQYNILKRQFIGYGPTFFVKKSVLDEVGRFDERFPLMDDYPLFIRIAAAGYKFHLMHEATVFYRVNPESVSHSSNDNAIISNMEKKCIREYKYLYKYEHLNGLWRQYLKYSVFLSNSIIVLGNNRKKWKCIAFNLCRLITDPFIWYSRYLNALDNLMKLL